MRLKSLLSRDIFCSFGPQCRLLSLMLIVWPPLMCIALPFWITWLLVKLDLFPPINSSPWLNVGGWSDWNFSKLPKLSILLYHYLLQRTLPSLSQQHFHAWFLLAIFSVWDSAPCVSRFIIYFLACWTFESAHSVEVTHSGLVL